MNWLKQKDKKLHFGGGVFAAFFVAVIYGFSPAFVAIWAIGHAKEEYDRRHPNVHTEEARDAFATSLGGLTGALLGSFIGEIL